MELEKLEIEGLNDVYALSVVKKEFKKAVDESWRDEKPWKRYQKTLLQDLAILDAQKEKAIVFEQFELLSGTENLYSIRHPKTQKNVRVLYTFTERLEVVLLVAFSHLFIENVCAEELGGEKKETKGCGEVCTGI